MSDIYDKLTELVTKKGVVKADILLAVAYHLYKIEKMKWFKKEKLDQGKSQVAMNKSFEQFVQHHGRECDLEEYIEEAKYILDEYNGFAIDSIYEKLKGQIAKELIVESEDRIVDRMNEHHRFWKSLSVEVVAIIVAPILIVILLFVLSFFFPELQKYQHLLQKMASDTTAQAAEPKSKTSPRAEASE